MWHPFKGCQREPSAGQVLNKPKHKKNNTNMYTNIFHIEKKMKISDNTNKRLSFYDNYQTKQNRKNCKGQLEAIFITRNKQKKKNGMTSKTHGICTL